MDPDSALGETESDTTKRARKQRPRPSKALPSDRMKFDVQVRVLRTFGRLSTGGQVIDPESLSSALNNEVSKYTAPLSHGFFVESGWLKRVGRGEYTATDALTTYARRDGAGAEDPLAPLRMTVKGSWYWRTVEPLLRHDDAPMSEVMVALMHGATVGEAHKPQIRMLLEWLRFLDLVNIKADKVFLTSRTADDPEPVIPEQQSDNAVEQEPEATTPEPPSSVVEHPRAEVPRPTTSQAGDPRPMLTFDFSCAVTAEDLVRLDADQIRALFEAVGTVAAITRKQP